MSQGDSQEKESVSLEEEILKRYVRQTEKSTSESELPSNSSESIEAMSTEEGILVRYNYVEGPADPVESSDREVSIEEDSLEGDVLEELEPEDTLTPQDRKASMRQDDTPTFGDGSFDPPTTDETFMARPSPWGRLS